MLRASTAAEVFLMQYGGGLPIGWGRVPPAEAHALGAMHVYEWAGHARLNPARTRWSTRDR